MRCDWTSARGAGMPFGQNCICIDASDFEKCVESCGCLVGVCLDVGCAELLKGWCGVGGLLTLLEMDLGHHTTGAAAAIGLDIIKGGVEDAVEGSELPDLIGGKGIVGLGGHDEEAFAGAVVDL